MIMLDASSILPSDFVLIGNMEDEDDPRRALLPLNPRRSLLRPVLLVSDHRRSSRPAHDFVLVGGAKDVYDNASAESLAAWIRNVRRGEAAADGDGDDEDSSSDDGGSPRSVDEVRVDTPRPPRFTVTKGSLDFVLMVSMEDDPRRALLPATMRRNLLQPVLLVSDYRRCCREFVLVGGVKDVYDNATAEAQAAWIRNARRAHLEKRRAGDYGDDEDETESDISDQNQEEGAGRGGSPRSEGAFEEVQNRARVDTPRPARFDMAKKVRFEERVSNDSVMSFL